jgi:Family of unknown function (DUF5681)
MLPTSAGRRRPDGKPDLKELLIELTEEQAPCRPRSGGSSPVRHLNSQRDRTINRDRTGPGSGAMETIPDFGHSRPPVHSRWKAGQSGNPRGRRPKHPAVALDQPTSDPPAESKVGYRQPPRHSRWKSGQSGNPRGGRPRDILQEVLLSPFPVKIGARTEMVPALDVMLLRIRARALEGDQKVIRSLIAHFGSSALERTLIRRSAK